MFWDARSGGFPGQMRVFTRLSVAVYFALCVLAMAGAAQAGPSSLRDMPEALQGAVSGAIGQDDPAYHLEQAGENSRGANPAQRLKAAWSEGGLAVQAGKLNWELRLEAWGYGEELAPAGRAVPEASGHRVEYRRDGLTEWYVNGPMGIEQGFTVLSPPEGASLGEALTLSLAWSGEARVEVEQNEAVVSNLAGEPALRYSGLSARDASGKDLRAWLEQSGASILLRVDDREATYPVKIDPLIQQQKLIASDGAPSNKFGYSAALSADGHTALIGAIGGGNVVQGAAYIFILSGRTWSQQQKLTASDGVLDDEFGCSVSLSADGSTALIGAGDAAVGANIYQGAAYIFVLSGGTWSQKAKLTASDGAAQEGFGSSVSLSSDGNTALIGEPYTGASGAYVFVNSGGAWSQQAKLTASCISVSLSADGNTALIGDYWATVGASVGQGAAYVFVNSGRTWSQQQILTASDGAPSNEFGYSAALSADGNTALIGAPGANANHGAAYVFVNRSGTWSQQQKLIASDGAVNDKFGYSAALSADGSTALMGAVANGDQGAAYVFVNSGGTWSQQQILTASDGAAADYFGFSAALSADGSTALMGAWNATVDGNGDQGAAYVFANNELVVNFGPSGLWQYRNGSWSELTSATPGIMAAYGNDLVALFPGAGLYRYDGAAWTELTPVTAIDMIAGMTDRVYVDFTGAGLWQYKGAWTQITPLNPSKMIAFGSKLVANFPGAGLYQYDGASWTQLTPLSTADIMVADGALDVYVNFPSAGLYAYNGSTWTGLTSLNPTMMQMNGNFLAANFAGFGLYSWNGDSWLQLTWLTAAQGLIGAWPNFYVNFGTYGLFKLSGANWTQITPFSPNLMGSMGSSLIANFSGMGLYGYDGSVWSELTPLSSATATIQVSWP